MSAMRIYNRADFEKALNENGFTKTELSTPESTLWHHEKSDKHVAITDSDNIPDFILDKYLNAVNSLYVAPKEEDCSEKQFAVTEKKSPFEVVK